MFFFVIRMSTTVSLTKAVDWRVTVGVPAMHRWPRSGLCRHAQQP